MTDIPEWVHNALYLGGGGLAVWLGLLLTGRRDRKSAENQLIDQLQEELKEYRLAQAKRMTAQDERMTAQDKRMERLEVLANGYRQYAHTLRAHIDDELGPPAPAWPEGLPQ